MREVVIKEQEIIDLRKEYVKIFQEHEASETFKKLKEFIAKQDERAVKMNEIKAEYETLQKEINEIQASEEFKDVMTAHRAVEQQLIDVNLQIKNRLVVEDLGEFEEISAIKNTESYDEGVTVMVKDLVEEFKEDLKKQKDVQANKQE